MLQEMLFTRYVRSFTEGRIRLRHPALEKEALATQAKASLLNIQGVLGVEINPQTGSALFIYDPNMLSKETLMQKGIVWAQWLEDCQKTGQILSPPYFDEL